MLINKCLLQVFLYKSFLLINVLSQPVDPGLKSNTSILANLTNHEIIFKEDLQDINEVVLETNFNTLINSNDHFKNFQNSDIPNGVIYDEQTLIVLKDTISEEKVANSLQTPSNLTEASVEDGVVLKEVEIDISSTENLNFEGKEEEGNHSISNDKHVIYNETEKTENLPKENLTEEIPSFSEWAQKQLEQAEKNKEPSNFSQPNGKSNKKRSKNYASPDCGAKIIAANPEAISPGSVLSPSRDEYKLNKCNSRIWFIVELCEAIQAKAIDLANFELFSSSPKEFSIYVSDRYPTRDWSNVGHFTAKDERDVQAFNLHPFLFGKYVKFEMHSHHGSEHYCPISLFRVYGTSEFEVLETEEQINSNVIYEDDDEETLEFDKEDVPKNLLSSATDAVISIVKKAAQVLGKNENNRSEVADIGGNITASAQQQRKLCVTPTHVIVCNGCDDAFYTNVYNVVSCETRFLKALLSFRNVKNALKSSNICSNYGLNFFAQQETKNNIHYSLLKIFPPKYTAALCNVLAVLENKIVRNSSSSCLNCTKTQLQSKDLNEKTLQNHFPPLVEEDEYPEVKLGKVEEFETGEKNDVELPTKVHVSEVVEEENEESNDGNADNSVVSEGESQEVKLNKMGMDGDSSDVDTSKTSEELEESTESLSVETIENQAEVQSSTISPVISQNKESVFVRLSNRIKVLERNMSLSGQYLEELSKRYKKQVEEMQRLIDKTLASINENEKKKDLETQRLKEQLNTLTSAIEALLVERNFWLILLNCLFLVFVSLLFFCFFCGRNFHFGRATNSDSAANVEMQRRKSDILTDTFDSRKKRRRSVEALKVGDSYGHLLIGELDEQCRKKEKKKRKKSQTNRPLVVKTNEEDKYRTIHTEVEFPFINSLNKRTQMDATSGNCNGSQTDDVYLNKIQDVPFVLDESEYSAVESFTFKDFSVKSTPNDIVSREFVPVNKRGTSLNEFRVKKDHSKNNVFHKKSASFDSANDRKDVKDTFRERLNNSYESNKISKDKRGAFKKILKSFNFRHKVNDVANC